MIVRSRSSRAFLAVTVAAIPLGAQAAALNLPTFGCNTTNNVESIGWGDGTLAGNKAGITLSTTGSEFKFSCENKLYSTGTISGESFSINFGTLSGLTDFELKFSISPFEHKDYIYVIPEFDTANPLKYAVTDFNLYLDAYKGDILENKYYVGVRTISTLKYEDFDSKLFIDDSGNLIFDPAIPGGSGEIRLLAAPEPVPEPTSLPLVATGLAAVAALLRRRQLPR